MENAVVTINNTKENTFELDVSVQGLSSTDIRVWFTISANGMDICFPCEREGGGDKWVCTVPPLPFIEHTAYPCSLQVVGDGYYFEPFNGTLNVVGNAEIYSTVPKNVTVKPANRQAVEAPIDEKDKKKKEAKVIKVEPPSKNKTKSKEKSIEQIAEELKAKMNANMPKVAPPVKAKKVETLVEKKVDPKVIPAKPAAKKPAAKKPAAASRAASAVKKIVETLKPVAPKAKPVRKEIVIPPAKLSNKIGSKSHKPVDESKENAIKDILEGIGIKVNDTTESGVKIHTDVKRSTPKNLVKGGEMVVDIDRIAGELMERANLDPKNADKKLAVKKVAAAKKIEESDAPVGKKNDAVMAILEDLGVKPDGATKSVKISFIKKDIH